MASPFFGQKSSAARARELFKPFADSASLLVEIEKMVFRFRFGIRWGECHKWACFCIFLATFTWPPTHWPVVVEGLKANLFVFQGCPTIWIGHYLHWRDGKIFLWFWPIGITLARNHCRLYDGPSLANKSENALLIVSSCTFNCNAWHVRVTVQFQRAVAASGLCTHCCHS